MKAMIYSTQHYAMPYFQSIHQGQHELQYVKEYLTLKNIEKIHGSQAVACFITYHQLDHLVLKKLQVPF